MNNTTTIYKKNNPFATAFVDAIERNGGIADYVAGLDAGARRRLVREAGFIRSERGLSVGA